MNANSLIEQIQSSPAAIAARDAYFAVAEDAPAEQPATVASDVSPADQAIMRQTARLKALLDRWEQRHETGDSASPDSYLSAPAEARSPHSRDTAKSPAMS